MQEAEPRSRSGSNKRQRTESKLIRFTPAELAQVEESASRAGLTLASYGRAQMLGGVAPRSVRRPPVEKELLARLLGQLGKAGSNLNQITRAMNQAGIESDDVGEVMGEVRQAAAAVLQALGRRA